MAGLRVLGVVALASFLGGCETMLPHFAVSDDFAGVVGAGGAAVEYCEAKGHFSVGSTAMFAQAAGRLDAATVIDAGIIEEAYNQTRSQVAGTPAAEQATFCQQVGNSLARIVPDMDRLTQRGWAAQSVSMAYTPVVLPVYQPFPIPVVGTQPSFGLQQDTTTTFYQNGTLTSCTTTSSGVVVCP